MAGRRREDAPRTDLPPEKDPYYEGYFGTNEEEGVVREREAGEQPSTKRKAPRAPAETPAPRRRSR